MYRNNLILGVSFQVLLSVVLIILSIATPILAEPNQSGNLGDIHLETIVTSNPLANILSIVFGILAILSIIIVTVSILALSNFDKAKKGEREFNSGLAVAAGVLHLFSLASLGVGISILTTISEAKDEVGYNNGSRRNKLPL